MKLVFSIIIILSITFYVSGQTDSSEMQTNLGVDLVNRYVWRGMMVSGNSNVQPYFSHSIRHFSFGTWATYSTKADYFEVDLYMGYTIEPVSFYIYDYWSTGSELSDYKYFNLKNSTTDHLLEFCVVSEKNRIIPLQLTSSVFLYGCDKNDKGKNSFSTYFEMLYPYELNDYEGTVFLGISPSGNYYSEKEFQVVNVGASVMRTIEITEKLKVPLKLSLTANPAAEKIFFIISLSI